MRPSIVPSRPGLTLLELLIAVSITVIAGLALTTVLTTIARGMTSSTESRSALQRAHAAYVRTRAYSDPALCLLQHDPDQGFAIWLNDAKVNNVVNLREFRCFWFHADTQSITIERVEFPEQWSEELKVSSDIALDKDHDFLAEMEVQRGLGNTVSETLCDGVRNWSVAHDAVSAQDAGLFRLTLTMNDGSDEPPQILAVHGFVGHQPPR